MANKGSIKPAVVAYIAFVLFGSLVSIINSNFNILAGHYQTTLSNISLMISAMALGRLSTIFISGVISDKIGRKPVIMVSITCLVICYAFIPLVNHFYMGLALITVAGMGHGMVDSTATALIFDCFPEKPNVPIGLIQAFFCLGAMSTPVVTSVLMSRQIYFGWLFWGLCLVGMAAIVWLLAIQFPPESIGPGDGPGLENSFIIKPDFKKEGLIIGVLVIFYSMTTTVITTWAGTYVYEVVGVSEVASIQVLTYYNIGCMLGTVIISRLLSKIHATIFLLIDVLGIFGTICLLTVIKVPQIVNVIFICTGLFAGINYSLVLSVVGEMFPKRKATASGATMSMSALGAIITPIVTGNIYKAQGVEMAFGVFFYVCVILIILAILFRKRYVKITNK